MTTKRNYQINYLKNICKMDKVLVDTDVILTRNVKDYVKSDIGVFTPESYLKSLSFRHK